MSSRTLCSNAYRTQINLEKATVLAHISTLRGNFGSFTAVSIIELTKRRTMATYLQIINLLTTYKNSCNPEEKSSLQLPKNPAILQQSLDRTPPKSHNPIIASTKLPSGKLGFSKASREDGERPGCFRAPSSAALTKYLCICMCTYVYVCIYMHMVPPPMYPRLSSQSRLWEGMGSWVAERRGLMDGKVPVNRMFLPHLQVQNSRRGPR